MKDNRRAFLAMLDEIWPGLQAEFTRSMARIRDQASLDALEQAIRRNDVQAAFDALRMDSAALFDVDQRITGAFIAGGKYQVDSAVHATRRAPAGFRITQRFGGRNERAERIAREMGARLVTEVIDDTRRMVAETIREGLEAGRNPRGTALDIVGRRPKGAQGRKGGLVGQHSQEAGYVRNARAELADPDRMANYFTRERRNRNFDSLVSRAMREGRALTDAEINRVAGAYADRLLNLRGERIARTETLKALNAGRMEGLDQLVESGSLERGQIKLAWDATGDSRTRDTHRAAEGQTIEKDGAFEVGGYRMRYPGDTSLGAPARETVSCRCYMAPVIAYFKDLR